VIKSDRWIIRMAEKIRMIEPFEAKQVKVVEASAGPKPVISYGVSSYGYDIRVARTFKVLDPTKQKTGVVDPKNFDVSAFEDFEGDVCMIPAHGMAIAQSFEYFRIPREVLVICNGKSTYTRCGIQVSIAPLEPEWEGHLTFSITNTTSLPAKVYAEEGIAQILFLESDEVCVTSYADKKGKYQRQTAFTPPKV
jgi:dCTP deaminase